MLAVKGNVEQEAELAQGRAAKIEQNASALAVTDNDSLAIATSLLGETKFAAKEIKLQKEGIIKPQLESISKVRELFKPVEEIYAAIEASLKEKISIYQLETNRKAKELADKLEARASAVDKNGRPLMRMDTAMVKLHDIDTAPIRVDTLRGSAQLRKLKVLCITDVGILVSENPDLLLRESVLEVLRKEVKLDMKAGKPCPNGVEMQEKPVVYASGAPF